MTHVILLSLLGLPMKAQPANTRRYTNTGPKFTLGPMDLVFLGPMDHNTNRPFGIRTNGPFVIRSNIPWNQVFRIMGNPQAGLPRRSRPY